MHVTGHMTDVVPLRTTFLAKLKSRHLDLLFYVAGPVYIQLSIIIWRLVRTICVVIQCLGARTSYYLTFIHRSKTPCWDGTSHYIITYHLIAQYLIHSLYLHPLPTNHGPGQGENLCCPKALVVSAIYQLPKCLISIRSLSRQVMTAASYGLLRNLGWSQH